jgi:hypothetical protein
MRKWPLVMLSKIGAIVMIGYVAWMGWQYLGPRKPEIGPVRKEMVDRLVPAITEDLRASRGIIREAVLLHFGNDPTDYFTNALRQGIEHAGVLDLRDRTVGEKLWDLLSLRHRPYETLSGSLQRGSARNAQAVLFGTVGALESTRRGSAIDVEVNLADVESGQIVFTKRYQKATSSLALLPATVQQEVKNFPWFQRLLGWAILVLLLPVFTIAFIRTMVRKESNKTNAFVLSIYTLVDAILAYLLVGAALTSWFTVMLFVVTVVAAFLYNIKVMSFALRLEVA